MKIDEVIKLCLNVKDKKYPVLDKLFNQKYYTFNDKEKLRTLKWNELDIYDHLSEKRFSFKRSDLKPSFILQDVIIYEDKFYIVHKGEVMVIDSLDLEDADYLFNLSIILEKDLYYTLLIGKSLYSYTKDNFILFPYNIRHYNESLLNED